MTTAAYNYKEKRVAVDSRFTSSDVIDTDKAIKYLTNDKGTWVLCGSPCDYDLFVTLNHKDKVDIKPNCNAFLIAGGKVVLVLIDTDGRCIYDPINENAAMGSGAHFALAAMDHGKSAKEAVKYAITRDIFSGGRVREFKV